MAADPVLPHLVPVLGNSPEAYLHFNPLLLHIENLVRRCGWFLPEHSVEDAAQETLLSLVRSTQRDFSSENEARHVIKNHVRNAVRQVYINNRPPATPTRRRTDAQKEHAVFTAASLTHLEELGFEVADGRATKKLEDYTEAEFIYDRAPAAVKRYISNVIVDGEALSEVAAALTMSRFQLYRETRNYFRRVRHGEIS